MWLILEVFIKLILHESHLDQFAVVWTLVYSHLP